MEHGQIVRFDKDYDRCPYITIKYRGQYLFLSTQTLNRREDFVEFVKDKYEDTGVNILDLPILDIIKQYVEEYNKNGYDIDIYNYGMIVKHKITNKYYGVVAARFNTEEISMIYDAIISHRNKTSKNKLNEIIYAADKISRKCYSCVALDTCKWSNNKKNKEITIQ